MYLAVYVQHQSQVLQVRVEQSRADEAHAEQRFNDVADGAVIRETDELSCCHKSAIAG